MIKVVIPLLALLLAACMLCAGVSAADEEVPIIIKSGSWSGELGEAWTIHPDEDVRMTVCVRRGTANGDLGINVTTGNTPIALKELSYNPYTSYGEGAADLTSLKLGSIGYEIVGFPMPSTGNTTLNLDATVAANMTSYDFNIEIQGKYDGTEITLEDFPINVKISNYKKVKSDIELRVMIGVGTAESARLSFNKEFIVKKYSEPDPDPEPPVPVTPTTTQTVKPTTVVTPTPGPTPATLPPSEKTITEVVTIPGSGIVPLTETTTLESVTFSSLNSVQKASVIATEGNTESMLLPPGVSPIQVGKVIDLSVHTENGEKISNVKGSFIVTEKVPQGKKLIVAHGIDTANNEWRDSPVTFRGNDQHEIPFESLSPFLLILIDAGSANPLLSQPTETPTAGITAEPTTVVPTTAAPSATATKSPVPFFGLIAGLAAAGLVLSRK